MTGGWSSLRGLLSHMQSSAAEVICLGKFLNMGAGTGPCAFGHLSTKQSLQGFPNALERPCPKDPSPTVLLSETHMILDVNFMSFCFPLCSQM